MERITWLVLVGVLLALTGCKSTNQASGTEHIIWVNSYTVECTGVAPQQCLLVYTGEELDSTKWEFFYDEIEGFRYRNGYIYKLRVVESERDQVAADQSSKVYKLLKVVERREDPIYRLNDIWVVQRMEDEVVIGANLPNMELDLGTMSVRGNDSCNEYRGRIQKLNDTQISFDQLISTRKMCPDMQRSMTFHRLLHKVEGYAHKGLHLHLLDGDGKVLIELKKVD